MGLLSAPSLPWHLNRLLLYVMVVDFCRFCALQSPQFPFKKNELSMRANFCSFNAFWWPCSLLLDRVLDKQCKLHILPDGIYVRLAGWLCLNIPWDANEAEISLSPIHLLPERGWFHAHMKMHKNLAPMQNLNMADYVRDCALPSLHQCKKTAKWTFSNGRKREHGAWSARF